MMAELVEGCRARGVELEEVSVGSTPTALVSATLDGITELRPGNYVFHDRTQVGLGRRGLGRLRAAGARVGDGVPGARPAGARLRQQGAVVGRRPRVRAPRRASGSILGPMASRIRAC